MAEKQKHEYHFLTNPIVCAMLKLLFILVKRRRIVVKRSAKISKRISSHAWILWSAASVEAVAVSKHRIMITTSSLIIP